MSETKESNHFKIYKVGFKGVTLDNHEFEIVKEIKLANKYKRFVIRFLDDLDSSQLMEISSTSLKKNCHFKRYRTEYHVGSRLQTLDGYEYEITRIEETGLLKNSKIEIIYLDNREKDIKPMNSLQNGRSFYRYFTNRNNVLYVIGYKGITLDGASYQIIDKVCVGRNNNSGRLKYEYTVEYDDGVIETCTYIEKLKREPQKVIHVEEGSIYENDHGIKIKVLKDVTPNEGQKTKKYLIEYTHNGFKKVMSRDAIITRVFGDIKACSADGKIHELKEGSIYKSIHGDIELIALNRLKNTGKSSQRHSCLVKIVSLNLTQTITPRELFTGVFFLRSNTPSVLSLQNSIHSSVFSYEYSVITDIIIKYGEAFFNSVIRSYTNDEYLDISYLDDLKFDDFKRFFTYLIEKKTIIKLYRN